MLLEDLEQSFNKAPKVGLINKANDLLGPLLS